MDAMILGNLSSEWRGEEKTVEARAMSGAD